MSKRPKAEAERGSVLNQLKAYRRADPTTPQPDVTEGAGSQGPEEDSRQEEQEMR